MDCTGAAASGAWPKLAAICGSAGVTMLALSWKDSTPSSRVEMSRAAGRPASLFTSVSLSTAVGGEAVALAGVFTSNSIVLCRVVLRMGNQLLYNHV